MKPALAVLLLVCFSSISQAAELQRLPLAGRRLNNLVSELLLVSRFTPPRNDFTFSSDREGWIFLSAALKKQATVQVRLDDERISLDPPRLEAMRHVAKGLHRLRLEKGADFEKLEVRAIPELIHCGLGFNPEIKSYGKYDWDFLAGNILPNITTLIVPNNLSLSPSAVVAWHAQGKKFVAEAGINAQASTAEDHAKFWHSFYERAPFLDGIIINEFIVNRPVVEWAPLTDERLERMRREREQYAIYGEALRKSLEMNPKKMLYAYVGGSGKKLNQEIIGTNFVKTIRECGYRIALERYLHEMSTPKGSDDALQTFLDGLADWEAKEPGVKSQMVIAFGLFSMPPGSINKQPNVDYHVWMDQQMNLVATHPSLAGLAGLEWWTSSLADEETVRFVGKLYRHYAIEGQTNRFTADPLFLPHVENSDFEKGTAGWTLQPAVEGSIAAKSFPRYGRIEGRFMGLGRPADPEHIGDTFLWMKRNRAGPNVFSQTIKNLEPGRLYSAKLLSCDYGDLVHPAAKKREEAEGFIGFLKIDGADVDASRSFREIYASSPEPKIPVWITYHWTLFRATNKTAKLTISDWSKDSPKDAFEQEQAFNFVEIQPYHE